ncbi:MAG: hypothetical protein WCW03_02100 [Candidatus Paceibacterota bacterium]|jgi:hypothetical protein
MVGNYNIVSPSLDGILSHESVVYDGLKRPLEIVRIFDRPEWCNREKLPERHIIEDYFHDLYGVLIKKISQFSIDASPSSDEAVKLQAMLQEFTKVKKLLAQNTKSE